MIVVVIAGIKRVVSEHSDAVTYVPEIHCVAMDFADLMCQIAQWLTIDINKPHIAEILYDKLANNDVVVEAHTSNEQQVTELFVRDVTPDSLFERIERMFDATA